MDYLTLALMLFALGVILLVAEVVLPTGGILVVGALLMFGIGLSVILAQGSTTEAVVALVGLALGLPVVGMVAVSAWRRLSLNSVLDEESDTVATVLNDLDSLKQKMGKTVSPMRPSGTVDFEGRRINAMTEGTMLDAGLWVRCVDVKGGKVIVRQIESPGVADMREEEPGTHETPQAPPPEIKKPEPKKPVDEFDDLDLGLDR